MEGQSNINVAERWRLAKSRRTQIQQLSMHFIKFLSSSLIAFFAAHQKSLVSEGSKVVFKRLCDHNSQPFEVNKWAKGVEYDPVSEFEEDPRFVKYTKIVRKPIFKSFQVGDYDLQSAINNMDLYTSKLTPKNLILGRLKELLQLYPLFKVEVAINSGVPERCKFHVEVSLVGELPTNIRRKVIKDRYALKYLRGWLKGSVFTWALEYVQPVLSKMDFVSMENRRAGNLTMGVFTLIYSMVKSKGLDALRTGDFLRFLWEYYEMSKLVKNFDMETLLKKYQAAQNKHDLEKLLENCQSNQEKANLGATLSKHKSDQEKNMTDKDVLSSRYELAKEEKELVGTEHHVKEKNVRHMYYVSLLPPTLAEKNFMTEFHGLAQRWEKEELFNFTEVFDGLAGEALSAIANEAFGISMSDVIKDFELSGAIKDLGVSYALNYLEKKLKLSAKRMETIIMGGNIAYENTASDLFDISLLPRIFCWSEMPKLDEYGKVEVAARELSTYANMLFYLSLVSIRERHATGKMPRVDKFETKHVVMQTLSPWVSVLVASLLSAAAQPGSIYIE